MFNKLGDWLKQIPNTIQTSKYVKDSSEDEKESPEQYIIKDADLEFLFYQLLEGVANGWQESSIEQFFQKLQPRITIETWLDWLQRYRRQLLASSGFHSQLAARMIILGEVTAKLPFVRGVGDLAYEIGKELLNRNKSNALVDTLSPLSPQNSKGEVSSPSSSSVSDKSKTTSLGDFLSLLQQDKGFATEIAQELGLDSEDAGMIIAKIVQQTESDSLPLFSQSTSEELVEYLFQLALEKVQNNDLEEALSLWNQVVSLSPQSSPPWHNRGSVLAYLHRFPEALECFERAIAIDVNDYLSWNDRGSVLFELKRWQEAIISWDRVLGIKPNHHQAWYSRGLALEKLGDISSALQSYQQCLKVNPDFSPAKKRCQQLQKQTPL